MTKNTLTGALAVTVLTLTACGSDDTADDAPIDSPPANDDVGGDAGNDGDDAGNDGDGDSDNNAELRPPQPIEIVSGSASNSTAAAATADVGSAEMSFLPIFANYEYSVGADLSLPGNDTGYVFDGSSTISADDLAPIAAALGVSADHISDWSSDVRDDDGTEAWLMFGSDDPMGNWSYQGPWDDSNQVVYCEVPPQPPEGSDATVPPSDCPEPTPPANVPDGTTAEQRAAELLSAIGVDPASVTFDTFADQWNATVTATRATWENWAFSFGAEGELTWASGSLSQPTAVGPYELIDLDAALGRLDSNGYPSLAATSGLAEPAIAVEGDASTSSPVPIDGSLPEPEPVEVTLVEAEADYWWAWDQDGSVWLLPAYRFIDTDGMWHVVPAVSDDTMIQVEAPQMLIEEPAPEPAEPADTLPDATLADTAPLEPLLGTATLEEFTAEAESLGLTVRPVTIDGEPQMATRDYRVDRINVTVEADIVTAIEYVG